MGVRGVLSRDHRLLNFMLGGISSIVTTAVRWAGFQSLDVAVAGVLHSTGGGDKTGGAVGSCAYKVICSSICLMDFFFLNFGVMHVCVCMCVCTCTLGCMCVSLCVCTWVYICVYLCVCFCVCMCTSKCVCGACVCTLILVFMCASLCVCVHMSVYVCAHVPMCVCIPVCVCSCAGEGQSFL